MPFCFKSTNPSAAMDHAIKMTDTIAAANYRFIRFPVRQKPTTIPAGHTIRSENSVSLVYMYLASASSCDKRSLAAHLLRPAMSELLRAQQKEFINCTTHYFHLIQ